MTAQKKHILIIEPNGITRKLLVGILNNRGFETYEASGGDEALTFLGKSPALVILDIDSEDAGIMGFLHKMKMTRSSLPLVAMSELEDTSDLEKRLSLGALTVLQKPVVPDALILKVEEHLVPQVEDNMSREDPAESDPALKERREEFMRRAIDLAQEALDSGNGGPFGAVVVRGDRIVGEGLDSVLGDKDPTAHAAIKAIRAAAAEIGDYSLEGCEIFMNCEPCPMSLAAIYWAHIDRVWYGCTREDADTSGFDFTYIQSEVAAPEHKRAMPSHMLLRAEAQIIFSNWEKKADKMTY